MVIVVNVVIVAVLLVVLLAEELNLICGIFNRSQDIKNVTKKCERRSSRFLIVCENLTCWKMIGRNKTNNALCSSGA